MAKLISPHGVMVSVSDDKAEGLVLAGFKRVRVKAEPEVVVEQKPVRKPRARKAPVKES